MLKSKLLRCEKKKILINFRYSEKATKIWPIFHAFLDITIVLSNFKWKMDQMFWSSQNIWTYSSSKLKKFLVKIKVNKNNTSEFISPPIFVGLGSNSAWPCAANWCINTLCYIFSLIYFENSFPANKLSSWISS